MASDPNTEKGFEVENPSGLEWKASLESLYTAHDCYAPRKASARTRNGSMSCADEHVFGSDSGGGRKFPQLISRVVPPRVAKDAERSFVIRLRAG